MTCYYLRPFFCTERGALSSWSSHDLWPATTLVLSSAQSEVHCHREAAMICNLLPPRPFFCTERGALSWWSCHDLWPATKPRPFFCTERGALSWWSSHDLWPATTLALSSAQSEVHCHGEAAMICDLLLPSSFLLHRARCIVMVKQPWFVTCYYPRPFFCTERGALSWWSSHDLWPATKPRPFFCTERGALSWWSSHDL